MFIFTQDEALVELTGSLRADTHPSYDNTYRVVLTRNGCTTTVAEYETQEEAKTAIYLIALHLEHNFPVCKLNTKTLSVDDLASFLAEWG